jgi:hypothetical protein
MSEQQPTGLPPKEAEEKDRPRTPEEQAQYIEDMLAWVDERHYPKEIPAAERTDYGPEIVELEGMMETFEATYSLEVLNAIIDVKLAVDRENPQPGDIELHPVREPARKALYPIVALLDAIEDEAKITREQLAELKAKYTRLSQAVGIINNKKVDHTRTIR